jgi:hypothetical protein
MNCPRPSSAPGAVPEGGGAPAAPPSPFAPMTASRLFASLAALTLAVDVTHAQTCTQTPNLPNGRVVWTEADAQVIRSSNLDGSGVTTLYASPGNGLFAIELDEAAGKLYFTSDSTVGGGIFRMNLDGTGVESLVTGGLALGLTLDPAANRMYWTDFTLSAARIRSANLDGSSQTTLVSGLVDPIDIVVDPGAGRLYWTDLTAGKIVTSMVDGSGVADLVTGLPFPTGIDIDVENGWLYYALGGTGELRRVGLGGAGDVQIAQGFDFPAGIGYSSALDTLLITDEGTGPLTSKLLRADLDGSELTALQSNLDSADDVLVYHDPVPTLYHDFDTVCLVAGGAQDLILDAGAANAGDLYFVLGSASGTTGIPIDGVVLPLSFDAYTSLTLVGDPGLFSGFSGLLGPDGRAKATVSVPAGASTTLAGATLFHAALVIDLATFGASFASSAAPLTLQL